LLPEAPDLHCDGPGLKSLPSPEEISVYVKGFIKDKSVVRNINKSPWKNAPFKDPIKCDVQYSCCGPNCHQYFGKLKFGEDVLALFFVRFFHYGRTMALGLTQPLTEMRTTNISWE